MYIYIYVYTCCVDPMIYGHFLQGLAKNRTSTNTEPGHYIAMLAFSRALSGIFMWHARFDITCVPLFGSLSLGQLPL